MSKHTPEPWPPFIDVCEPATPHPDSNDIVCLGFDDYRRARACVNACREIGTDELEQHGLVSLLATQREELLAALQGMIDIANDSQGVAGYHLNGEVADWGEFEEWQAACDAIAKAKGGAS